MSIRSGIQKNQSSLPDLSSARGAYGGKLKSKSQNRNSYNSAPFNNQEYGLRKKENSRASLPANRNSSNLNG